MDLRMETSQAVSMLQPFRHPKPGLTIMKRVKYKTWRKLIQTMKAEEWLSNHIEAPFNNRMYTAKEVCQLLDEYAQQVSREVAEKAWNYVENAYRGNYNTELIKKRFDEWWKSNQEESNG